MTLATPTQELAAKDLHGYEWRFKHIFRGKTLMNVCAVIVVLLNNDTVCFLIPSMTLFAPLYLHNQVNHVGICLRQVGVLLSLPKGWLQEMLSCF